MEAGTRQSQVIFGFLLDPGERVVSKDEFLEVIWPDIPIEKVELGFHRTLGGLRRVLQPDFGRSNSTPVIAFGNDRYRLNPALIDWSDVEEFRELVSKTGRASDPAEARGELERARSLYRGDYLDDSSSQHGKSVAAHSSQKRPFLAWRLGVLDTPNCMSRRACKSSGLRGFE